MDAFDIFWRWANTPLDRLATIPAELPHAVTSMPEEDLVFQTLGNADAEATDINRHPGRFLLANDGGNPARNLHCREALALLNLRDAMPLSPRNGGRVLALA